MYLVCQSALFTPGSAGTAVHLQRSSANVWCAGQAGRVPHQRQQGALAAPQRGGRLLPLQAASDGGHLPGQVLRVAVQAPRIRLHIAARESGG